MNGKLYTKTNVLVSPFIPNIKPNYIIFKGQYSTKKELWRLRRRLD